MTKKHRRGLPVLGMLGLCCVALVAWAVTRLDRQSTIDVAVARVVLALVTTVGWLVDHVPPPAPRLQSSPKIRLSSRGAS